MRKIVCVMTSIASVIIRRREVTTKNRTFSPRHLAKNNSDGINMCICP